MTCAHELQHLHSVGQGLHRSLLTPDGPHGRMACGSLHSRAALAGTVLASLQLCSPLTLASWPSSLSHAAATRPALALWPQPGLRPAMSCCRLTLLGPPRPWHPAQRLPWRPPRLRRPAQSPVRLPAFVSLHVPCIDVPSLTRIPPLVCCCCAPLGCSHPSLPAAAAAHTLCCCSRDSRTGTCPLGGATERGGDGGAVGAADPGCHCRLHAGVRLSRVSTSSLELPR